MFQAYLTVPGNHQGSRRRPIKLYPRISTSLPFQHPHNAIFSSMARNICLFNKLRQRNPAQAWRQRRS